MHAETAYLFRHVLMRDAAYQLQPPTDRAALHKLALGLLEEMLPPAVRRDLAEELADHAREAMPAAADHRERHELARREVSYLTAAGELAAGLYAADRAVQLLSRAADHPACDAAARYRALVTAGNARIVEGMFEAARGLLQRIDTAGLTPAQHCEWRLRLAEVELRTGQNARVLELASQTVELAESAKLPQFVARASALRASALMLWGKLDEALAQYAHATEIARQTGDEIALIQAEVNTASILRRRGCFAEAEPLLRRCIAALSQPGRERSLAIAQQNLSNLLLELRRYDEARQWLSAAERTYRQVGDRNGMANVIGARGIQYHYERRFDRAAEAYREAAERFHELGAPRGEMRNWANLGTALAQLGRHDEAMDMAQRALALARRLGDRENEGVYLGQRAVAHKLAGRLQEALTDFRASLAITDNETGLRNSQVLVNHCHACELHDRLGNVEEAQRAADRARVIRDRMPPEHWQQDPDTVAVMGILDRYPPRARTT
jgi:tetratricopeptide (TPR) repeat protein